MSSKQQVQQCIQQCTQAANQLRSATNTLQDNRSREMATLGAAHIEMCVHACESTMHHIQATGKF